MFVKGLRIVEENSVRRRRLMWRWWLVRRKGLIFFVFLILCFVCNQYSQAALVTDWQDWSIRIPIGYDLTGFAFFVYEDLAPSLTFSDVDDLESGYTGPDEDITDWEFVMEEDNKQFSFAGPGFTNDSGFIEWFNFQIEFTWESEDVIDEIPVHMDSAIYNGGLDTAPAADWKHFGDPITNSWTREDEPYEVHSNPAPEPMTILFLGLGGLFLIRTRRNYV
ncbi:MAG: PEP-CTERM sorting domain-containing protein [Planctomycetota bacterium]